jgi:hypothetical protein
MAEVAVSIDVHQGQRSLAATPRQGSEQNRAVAADNDRKGRGIIAQSRNGFGELQAELPDGRTVEKSRPGIRLGPVGGTFEVDDPARGEGPNETYLCQNLWSSPGPRLMAGSKRP